VNATAPARRVGQCLLEKRSRCGVRKASDGFSVDALDKRIGTTMANLAHSISHAPVDRAFAPQAWPAAAA
jgi:hypothetical protein